MYHVPRRYQAGRLGTTDIRLALLTLWRRSASDIRYMDQVSVLRVLRRYYILFVPPRRDYLLFVPPRSLEGIHVEVSESARISLSLLSMRG